MTNATLREYNFFPYRVFGPLEAGSTALCHTHSLISFLLNHFTLQPISNIYFKCHGLYVF
jgi:hypothetical protein